jgi:hypothetical protein
MEIFNIYCDESCHLEHDGQSVMLLGAVWCPDDKTRDIARKLRSIKASRGLGKDFELKWSKVSPGQVEFYLDVLKYFFAEEHLHFRVLVVSDKSKLRHEAFKQDHDTFYYKMYFTLLKVLLNPHAKYRIYLDIKDTRSSERIKNLHDVLCNNMYDFSREIIERVQPVSSDQIEQVQLADMLIGIVAYANRGLASSSAKAALVDEMRKRTGYSLTRTTLLREDKVNIFKWEPSESQ